MEKIRKGEGQKREAAWREKVRKSRNTVFFQRFLAPGGGKGGEVGGGCRASWPDER